MKIQFCTNCKFVYNLQVINNTWNINKDFNLPTLWNKKMNLKGFVTNSMHHKKVTIEQLRDYK